MKFGTEFDSRSVSRWKNYNIDYNLIKTLIREATTGFDDSSSSSSATSGSDDTSNSTTSTLNSHQKKLLKNLYKNFQDQIDFVSLFVFSKVGEISRRLSALKRQCNYFLESESETRVPSGMQQDIPDVKLRLRKRKLLLFHKELDSITTELKDLSRFLLLQKIAVKKLFKKFIKYSSYPKRQAFIDRINDTCLLHNPKSFVHLKLDDLTLETTLLYEFLDTCLKSGTKTVEPHNTSNDFTNSSPRNSSIHTIDSLALMKGSYTNSNPDGTGIDSTGKTETSAFSRSTTFDILSKRKGPKSMMFWVHTDNLDELKFLLSSTFKLITDQSLFSNETRLKNTRSTIDLKDNDNNSSSPPTKLSASTTKKEDFTPETQTVSVWLNNPAHFKFIKTTDNANIDYTPESPETLNIFKAHPYPQILVSNFNQSTNQTNNENNPILITPIGGLRQFSIATLNRSLIDSMFHDEETNLSKDEKKSKLFSDWQKSNLDSNSQMSQLSFNYVIDEDVKPLASVSSSKLRFINLNDSEKIDSYISLDWDIKIFKSNNNLHDTDLTPQSFPYAILEIDYELPEAELPENILNLINSYLVYRVDQFNFSLNNFLIYSYINQYQEYSVSDDEMMLFIAPWHELLNEDIRSLPEMRTKISPVIPFAPTSPALEAQNGGILLNKNDEICKKPGYWNEFDNGSDYGDDDNGFYVYEAGENDGFNFFRWFTDLFTGKPEETRYRDTESNRSLESHNTGLQWISPENTNKLLKLADGMTNLSRDFKNKVFHSDDSQRRINENLSLLRHNNSKNNNHYFFGSTDNEHVGDADGEHDDDDYSDSDTEAMLSSLPSERRDTTSARSEIYITKENHDKCLSFLYLTMIVCSTLTSSIGALIINTVFASDTQYQPQLTGAIIVLITFAIFCLTLSLILTGFSISLLNFRFKRAPIWHSLVVCGCALISTTFFFYGLTSCI